MPQTPGLILFDPYSAAAVNLANEDVVENVVPNTLAMVVHRICLRRDYVKAGIQTREEIYFGSQALAGPPRLIRRHIY